MSEKIIKIGRGDDRVSLDSTSAGPINRTLSFPKSPSLTRAISSCLTPPPTPVLLSRASSYSNVEPKEVRIRINVFSILSIDTAKGTFTSNFQYEASWTDKGLKISL